MRVCIFCDQPATTAEHVIPAWALEVIGRLSRSALNRMQMQFGEDGPSRTWRVRGSDSSSDSHIRVKRLCLECNSRWMSQLEDLCRPSISPLMNDLSIPISYADQRWVATWGLKTAMVFECVRGGQWFYSQADREHLRATLAPTIDTKVWLGRHSRVGDLLSFAEGKKLGSGAREPIHGALLREGYVTTFALAHLVIQILTIRRPDSPRGITLHSRPGPWDDRGLIEIWPPSGPVQWPPALTFREERELDGLSGRFAIGSRGFSPADVLAYFAPE